MNAFTSYVIAILVGMSLLLSPVIVTLLAAGVVAW